ASKVSPAWAPAAMHSRDAPMTNADFNFMETPLVVVVTAGSWHTMGSHGPTNVAARIPPVTWGISLETTSVTQVALCDRYVPMIEFQHVFKSYGRGRNILADVNFRIGPGEFVFVSGPSGAGKSTLLKLIGGLEPPSRGATLINGHRSDRMPARARPYLRRAVGVSLRDAHLPYDRSAMQNVLLPLAVTGHSPAQSL